MATLAQRIRKTGRMISRAIFGSAPKLSQSITTKGVSLNHKLQTLISDCIQYDPNQPKERVALNKLLIRNIPVLNRAVEMRSQFVGDVDVITDNDQLKEYIKPWMESVPMLFEDNLNMKQYFGFNNYAKQMSKIADLNGMMFSEDRLDESGSFYGILVPDPERFEFIKNRNQKVLQYTPQGGAPVLVDTESRFFEMFGINFVPGSLWGLTMLDGGQFFGEILIHMLVSMKNNHVRDGSPVGINVFGLEGYEDFTTEDFETLKSKVATLENATMNALRDAQLGKQSEVFHLVPGELKAQHWTYGEGLQAGKGRKDEIMLIINQLASLTGIPVELLLSEDAAGAGFSGEKWRVLYRLLMASASTTQMLMKPKLRNRIVNKMLSDNVPLNWYDEFEIKFNPPNFQNEQTQSEIDAARAETLERLTNLLQRMFTELQIPVSQLNELIAQFGFDITIGNQPNPNDA